MKKILTLAVTAALAMGMLVGCGAKKVSTNGEAVKTGVAVISSIEKSAAAGEKDGNAQIESTVVAVLVDASGKIVNAKIDVAQTKVAFSKEGKVLTDITTKFDSKQTLGDAYGMKVASTIGKEWHEQANFLADYVIGKTVEEVKAIKVEESKATDADLKAGITVSIGGYIQAIEKAVANAKDLGAKSGDKLGLGVSTTIDKSKDATAEADGQAQAYSVYTAVSVDASGKISSTAIDSSQSNVKFNAKGEITTDLTAELKTKQELGTEYGMVPASSIGKEWNEQADALAKYVTGKTLAEVKGIKLNDDTVPTESDLTATVTIKIGDYVANIERAINSAK